MLTSDGKVFLQRSSQLLAITCSEMTNGVSLGRVMVTLVSPHCKQDLCKAAVGPRMFSHAHFAQLLCNLSHELELSWHGLFWEMTPTAADSAPCLDINFQNSYNSNVLPQAATGVSVLHIGSVLIFSSFLSRVDVALDSFQNYWSRPFFALKKFFGKCFYDNFWYVWKHLGSVFCSPQTLTSGKSFFKNRSFWISMHKRNQD